jgi:hypothetical protein
LPITDSNIPSIMESTTPDNHGKSYFRQSWMVIFLSCQS